MKSKASDPSNATPAQLFWQYPRPESGDERKPAACGWIDALGYSKDCGTLFRMNRKSKRPAIAKTLAAVNSRAVFPFPAEPQLPLFFQGQHIHRHIQALLGNDSDIRTAHISAENEFGNTLRSPLSIAFASTMAICGFISSRKKRPRPIP